MGTRGAVVGMVGLCRWPRRRPINPWWCASDLPASTSVILAVSHSGRSVVYADN